MGTRGASSMSGKPSCSGPLELLLHWEFEVYLLFEVAFSPWSIWEEHSWFIDYAALIAGRKSLIWKLQRLRKRLPETAARIPEMETDPSGSVFPGGGRRGNVFSSCRTASLIRLSCSLREWQELWTALPRRWLCSGDEFEGSESEEGRDMKETEPRRDMLCLKGFSLC